MNANTNQSRTLTIATNTLYMFIRVCLVTVVSFYTSRIILKVLGVSDFGIYNIVASFTIFLSFFKQALSNATNRYLTYAIVENASKLRRLFTMCVNAHILLSIIVVLVIEFIGTWFLNTKLNIPIERLSAANWILHFSAISFFIEILRTPYDSIIIAHEKLSFYSLTSIVEVILKLFVVFLLQIFTFDKLILYALLLLFVSLSLFSWYILYCRRNFPETKYIRYWSTPLLKELVSYSGWSVLVNAADMTVVQGISIFLNLFYGVVANAAMGIANQVNSLLNTLLNSFSTSYKPQIIKSYASNDTVYFINLLYSTSKISFYLMFLIALPIMINIHYILVIWLENPPELSGVFLQCIVFYSLFDSFSVPLWTAIHATGKLKWHQIIMSAIKLFNVPLGYLMLSNDFPSYSILILYAGLNGVCSFVRIWYLKFLINLNVKEYLSKVILPIILVALPSALIPLSIIYVIKLDGLLKLIVSSFSFIIVYITMLYLLGLNTTEKFLIKKLLHVF